MFQSGLKQEVYLTIARSTECYVAISQTVVYPLNVQLEFLSIAQGGSSSIHAVSERFQFQD